MIAVAMVLTFLTNVYPGKQYTEAWKTYTDFNDARTMIFDYSYISDEEALQPILEKYGVEQEELAAFRQYWMLGNPIPTECLEEIYESVKPVEEEAFFTPDLLKSLLRYRFSGENFHLGRCAFLGYVLVTMAIVFSGKWKFLIPLGAVNVGRLGLLLYLMYHARLPFRVISILYFAELAFMMLLAFLIFREVEWKKWKQALVILYLLGSVLVFTKFFYSNQLYLAEKNRVAEIACEGLVEIYDYCDMHPGKYVVENAACTWYVSDIFDTRVYHSRNLLVAGGWYSFSPEIVAYEKKYLAQNGETYIVFRTNVDEVKEHYVYKYLVNAKGCELIWRDHIDIITGDRLEVYQLIGEYPYEDG